MTLRPDAQHSVPSMESCLLHKRSWPIHVFLPCILELKPIFIHILSLCFFQQGLERRKQMPGCVSCIGKKNQFMVCAVKMLPVLKHIWTFTYLSPLRCPVERRLGCPLPWPLLEVTDTLCSSAQVVFCCLCQLVCLPHPLWTVSAPPGPCCKDLGQCS